MAWTLNEKNISISSKSKKKYSTSLVIDEMQNKTYLTYHYLSITMAELKKKENATC